MMSEEIKTILSRTAVKTLEKLAFLFAFTDDDADAGGAAPKVAARVSFAGVFSGTLIMQMPLAALPELTANMLGIEEQQETTPDQQYDALKETLNVICGNLLPAVAGRKPIFDIDPPQIIPENETLKNVNGRKPLCQVTLALDQGSCALFLFTDDRIPLNTQAKDQA
jgi:CheY-specific phosphatase CheX